jgi:hypothetical protein
MMLTELQWLDPSSSSSVELDIRNESLGDHSSELFEYDDRKLKLEAIIDSMVLQAPSWDSEPMTVSAQAARTAKRFLQALPRNRELPKVAPDGEGDLLFVWEKPYGSCIVTVQPNVLHLVDRANTRYAEHIDAQCFVGYQIPISILHAIPLR